MFSFFGDTVLDPFCGTGTTMLAAMKANRNSIGVEIDPVYCDMAMRRLEREAHTLFDDISLEMVKAGDLRQANARAERNASASNMI